MPTLTVNSLDKSVSSILSKKEHPITIKIPGGWDTMTSLTDVIFLTTF